MTNETKHTAAPWQFKPHGEQANPYWHQGKINAGALLVAQVDLTNAQKQGEANARRIVACVNYCVGIPTETIEQGAVDVYESGLFNKIDELAAACRLVDQAEGGPWDREEQLRYREIALVAVRAALAKLQS